MATRVVLVSSVSDGWLLPADRRSTGVPGTRKTLNLCADLPMLIGCPERHAPNNNVMTTPTAPDLPTQVRGVAGQRLVPIQSRNFVNFLGPEGRCYRHGGSAQDKIVKVNGG